MWTHHASREVKGRLLQGQQSHPSVSACSLHISWFHVSAKEGTEQNAPDFHQFPTRCEYRCDEEDATSGAGVETESSDTGGACCASSAIQPNHPRVVELLRGILSNGHASCLSAHRLCAGTMGQAQI